MTAIEPRRDLALAADGVRAVTDLTLARPRARRRRHRDHLHLRVPHTPRPARGAARARRARQRGQRPAPQPADALVPRRPRRGLVRAVRPSGAPRVVSLVPSVTETLTAWGVVPVASTRFCERDDLAHVGGTKDLTSTPSPHSPRTSSCSTSRRIAARTTPGPVPPGPGCGPCLLRPIARRLGLELGGLASRLGIEWTPPRAPDATAPQARAFVPSGDGRRMAPRCAHLRHFAARALDIVTSSLYRRPYPLVEPGRRRCAAPRRRARRRASPIPCVPSDRGQTSRQRTSIDGKDLFWSGAATPGALAQLRAALAALLG